MPVPYKHQLRRAQAIDELDWPPQASSSGSSDSLGSGEAAPTEQDGIFKVMLVGESGVGKSTLAGTFGGLQGDSAHEPENPGIWRGNPERVKGTCGPLVRDARGMSSPQRPKPKRSYFNAFCGNLPGGGPWCWDLRLPWLPGLMSAGEPPDGLYSLSLFPSRGYL